MPRHRISDHHKRMMGTFKITRKIKRTPNAAVDNDCSPPDEFNEQERQYFSQFIRLFNQLEIIDELNLPAINILTKCYSRAAQQLMRGEANASTLSAVNHMLGAFGCIPQYRGNFIPFTDD